MSPPAPTSLPSPTHLLTADESGTRKRRSLFGRLFHSDGPVPTFSPGPEALECLASGSGETPNEKTNVGVGVSVSLGLTAVGEREKEREKEKRLTNLKDAAGAHLPAVSEESDPPTRSPTPTLAPVHLFDLAQILSEAPSRPCSRAPSPKPGRETHPPSPKHHSSPKLHPQHPRQVVPSLQSSKASEYSNSAPSRNNSNLDEGELKRALRTEPPTPPATPMTADKPGRGPVLVGQLAPVLEMDHALALAQAHLFDDEPPFPPSSASTSLATTPSISASHTPSASGAWYTPPNGSASAWRATEPATPPATPMTPMSSNSARLSLSNSPLGTVIERDFAFSGNSARVASAPEQEIGERSEPPTPPATPINPCSTVHTRVWHASQLTTVLEVDQALTLARDSEPPLALGDGDVKGEPATPPATPMTPAHSRGASRRLRQSTFPPGIPPVLELGEEGQTRKLTGEVALEIADAVPEVTPSVKAGEVRTLLEADEEHVAFTMAETIAPSKATVTVPAS